VIFLVVLLVFFCFHFSVLAKRLGAKSISEMTYFVLNGTLHLNSVINSVIALAVPP